MLSSTLVDMRNFSKKTDKKRRFLFVVVTCLRDEGNAGNIQDFPYGVLSIIKYNEGLADFSVLDLIVRPGSMEDALFGLKEKVSAFSPDIVGVSVMFDNAYFSIDKICQTVKQKKEDIFVVLGGPAVSPIAEKVLNNQPSVDAVCFSEGEIPVRELIQADDLHALVSRHPSWVARSRIALNGCPQKTLLEDLNLVIDVNYDYVNPSCYERRVSFNPIDDRYIDDLRSFPLITSRGCPFKCTFCWHSGEDDKLMRYADVDALIAHLTKLKSAYGANCVIIYDDMLLLNIKRAKEIFRKIAPLNLRIELPNGLSPTYMDEELVQLMYTAGVRSVRLAIESGDEWVIRNLVNKPMRIRHVDSIMTILKKYNIWVVGFFVLGLPGETDAHRELTKNKILEWGVDQSSISIASPIKGSLLYEQCIEEGYIKNESDDFTVSGFLFGENIINTKDFTAEEITEQSYIMNLEVNFVNSNRLNIGDYKSAEKFFKFVADTYKNHGFAHYYLAVAKKNIGDMEMAQYHYDIAKNIYLDDERWRSYFNRFGIYLDRESLALSEN